jgi:hypothetical protein
MPCRHFQYGNWQKRGISDHGSRRSIGVLVGLLKFCLILLAGSIIISTMFWIATLPFFSRFLFVPLLPPYRRTGKRPDAARYMGGKQQETNASVLMTQPRLRIPTALTEKMITKIHLSLSEAGKSSKKRRSLEHAACSMLPQFGPLIVR